MSFLQSQVKNLIAENMLNEQTQKTNLEESSLLDLEHHKKPKKHHHKHHKKHHKHKHHSH
jgi:hypothetical protein